MTPGLLYDGAGPQPPTTPARMAKAKLELDRKSDSEVVTFALAHISAMTGNANFPTPNPPPAEFFGRAHGV